MNKLLIILSSLFVSIAASADIAIIVSKDSTVGATETDEIRRVYLGKSNSLSGLKVTPLNQIEGNSITENFNSTLLNKSNSQLKAYWSKLVFTGKGEPPKELGSDSEVISTVSKDSSAVGYVDTSSVNDSVKVIATLKN